MSNLPLTLGFLAFTSYHEPGGTAKQSLEDTIKLFQFAESRNFDGGWLRVRHFERALTGVFPFLGALARETDSIRIGTAVIPIAHENPVRLAEDSATADILSDQRLEIGVSTGIASVGEVSDVFARAYGHEDGRSVGERSQAVLGGFLRNIAGEEVAPTDPGFRLQFTDEGEGARIYPHSPRLSERIWYGSGTESSVIRAARLGLNLQVSTINTAGTTDLTVPQEQALFFDRYSENLDLSGIEKTVSDVRPRQISISRYVVPYSTQREKDLFLAASDRHVPKWPTLNGQGWNVGTVDEVIEQLLADEAIARARREFNTTLLLNLPSTLGLEWTRHLLEKVQEEVFPALTAS
ncbi:LLM class flavin-dependent oxidoreductase [Corynebacterium pacaense]|uniref:LLM class flavin-dependent oxidoreductase n=1 Tax=Corynebacterium pacaense TaxID=1816684 RepID=UPI0009BC618B|nr:LLM class flavin-dependent oxidoreductase [Corynebacterium pacaense]